MTLEPVHGKFYFWYQVQAKDAALSSDHSSKDLGTLAPGNLVEPLVCLFIIISFHLCLLSSNFYKNKQKLTSHLLYCRHLFSQRVAHVTILKASSYPMERHLLNQQDKQEPSVALHFNLFITVRSRLSQTCGAHPAWFVFLRPQ